MRGSHLVLTTRVFRSLRGKLGRPFEMTVQRYMLWKENLGFWWDQNMILECFFFFKICISLSPFKVRQYSHLTGEGMATGGGGSWRRSNIYTGYENQQYQSWGRTKVRCKHVLLEEWWEMSWNNELLKWDWRTWVGIFPMIWKWPLSI